MKIVVRGVRSQSGFGVATIGLLKLIKNTGNDLRFIPVGIGDTTQDSIGLSKDTMGFLESITINETDPFIKDSVFIDVGSLGFGLNVPKPDNISKYILYTTTETTTINNHYVEEFNNKFDEIWTASKFNKATYFTSGVTVPIKILPHLVDTQKFNPELKPYKIKNKRKFNFILNIDFSYRKGLHLLLPAWLKAFSADDDVALIMKVSNNNFSDPKAPIAALNNLLFKFDYTIERHAPILVIPTMIDELYLPNLYTTGDVYIAPTLGEGFGFPIAESMACGIPTIVSNCSAPSEYVNADEGFLIHLNEEQPVQPITDETLLRRDPNYKGRFIYNISEESLIEQLKQAYNTPKETLKLIGEKARATIENRFSVAPLTTTLISLLED